MEEFACCDQRKELCAHHSGSDNEDGSVMSSSGEGEGSDSERTRWSVREDNCGVCKCYGSGDDVSWRPRTARYRGHCHSPIDSSWSLVFVLLIVSTSVTAQLRPNKDIVVSSSNEGVCQSQDIRNSVNNFSQLRGCRVIEGFLQIVLIDKAEEWEYANLTFPELREITGYFLVYRVNGLRSLSRLFPNLTVIRGNELFFDYALVVFEMMHLQELGLISLTDILRGGVYFVKNPMLCYIDTIDWDLIAKQAPKGPDAKKEEIHFIRGNKKKNECPICPTDKKCAISATGEHLCWNGQVCQKVCPISCGLGRTCNEQGECCDDHCLGGCNGTGPDSCYACKGVLFKNKCLQQCPVQTFEYLNRRCILESDCHNMPKPRQLSSDDEMRAKPWKVFNNQCILHCPPGYLEAQVVSNDSGYSGTRKYYTCEPCKGYCKKECGGANVDSIASAQKLRDCTYIKGSLEIQIRGGINVVKELEENLKMIEEIYGYLKIVRSFPLVSLNFLKKLKVIHGNKLESNKYALVVLDNQNLVELWDWETRGRDFKIENGRLFFHFNPKLCISKIDKLKEVAKLSDYTDLEVARNSNGDKVACNVTVLQASVYKRTSKAVLIRWKQFAHYDSRTLLGYVVYSIEAPYQNVTLYDGRDACGGDGWRVDDVSPEKDVNEPQEYILPRLKPFTQYAFYVKTYTIATEKSGAQSPIQYFWTFPDTPTSPVRLKAYSNSSSELVISWGPPLKPNGNVTHYVVTGTWEKDDPEFLEQRNYCSEPLTLPDKTRQPLPSPDEDGDDEDNVQKSVDEEGIDGDTCECNKNDNEKKKQKEKEIQFQIHFEDALLNQVYVKRNFTVSFEDAVTETSAADTRPSVREKREINYRENKGQQGNHFPDSPEGHKYVGATTNTVSSRQKVEQGVYVNFEKVVWNRTSLVVRNLRHFAVYTIAVMACRERIPEESQRDNKNCSAEAIVAARTLPLETADNVKSLTLQVMENTNSSFGEVLLRWEEPKQPNSLIVTYQIEYRRVDIENYKPTVECITRRQYENKSNTYLLKNLLPGNYSVRLRATSLAGNGDYTSNQYFYIQERSTVPTAHVLIITVFGLLILVAVMCLMVFYLRRLYAHDSNRKLIASVNPEYVSTVYVPDEWEVPRRQVELLRELGQGSFGMVYEGICHNIVKDQPAMPCAIKTVNETATDRERIEFLNEASVMKAFNTHHVVRLLGVVSKGQPTLVVMELMANGDLKSYLRSHRPDVTDDPTKQPPTLRRILQMAIEIADGMAYLSAKKFVHRDLAARNCMVSEDLTVKIGDFGMTRDIYETDYYRKGTKGLLPVRWMAPESLKDGVFTSYSDVWSYGVVLWEMATLASQPYQGLSNDQVLRYVIDGGIMERPENCPDKMYDMMKRCWQHKPVLRPSFVDIVSMLLSEVSTHFSSVSFYHSEEGAEVRGSGVGAVGGGEDTPLRVTREIEDFSLGSDDEDCYKQHHSSGSSKVSNGSTTPTPNGYIVARPPNGNPAIKTTKC